MIFIHENFLVGRSIKTTKSCYKPVSGTRFNPDNKYTASVTNKNNIYIQNLSSPNACKPNQLHDYNPKEVIRGQSFQGEK